MMIKCKIIPTNLQESIEIRFKVICNRELLDNIICMSYFYKGMPFVEILREDIENTSIVEADICIKFFTIFHKEKMKEWLVYFGFNGISEENLRLKITEKDLLDLKINTSRIYEIAREYTGKKVTEITVQEEEGYAKFLELKFTKNDLRAMFEGLYSNLIVNLEE